MYVRMLIYFDNSLKGLSVSNGLTEHDKSENKTVTSPSEEPYALTTKAFSEGSFVEPLLHYDYASLGARKVRICVLYVCMYVYMYVCMYVTTTIHA